MGGGRETIYLSLHCRHQDDSRNTISIQKTLIIPQGAILLWSWRARKKIYLKKYIKLREQYNKHNTTNKETYFNHSKVMNIEQL